MRVLVAPDGRGKNGRDFTWTEPGELLTLGFVCCDSGNCGCERSFTGLDTSCATTRSVVAERPYDELAAYVPGSRFVAGWGGDDEIIRGVLEDMKMLDEMLVETGASVGAEVRVRQSFIEGRQDGPISIQLAIETTKKQPVAS